MGERGFHARCLLGRIFDSGTITLDQLDSGRFGLLACSNTS